MQEAADKAAEAATEASKTAREGDSADIGEGPTTAEADNNAAEAQASRKQAMEEGKEAAKEVAKETAPPARAAALLPSKPVKVGTKGSFQEVLARRQAELAALRGGKPPPPKRTREVIEPPPPRYRLSLHAQIC